jgi:DNA-3-methyladenine glycosylase I
MKEFKVRCAWAGHDPLYLAYHDQEWGVPQFDDRKLFEMLILEGAQAGLSWSTILRKREGYRRALDGFDAEAIATYDQSKIESLLQDSTIVRNRLKIGAAITNARIFLDLQGRDGGFSGFIWQFTDGQPVTNHWQSVAEVPARTETSDTMSRVLKKLGFKFVGATICYAFMQAVGMVNDHTLDCFRHGEIESLHQHTHR